MQPHQSGVVMLRYMRMIRSHVGDIIRAQTALTMERCRGSCARYYYFDQATDTYMDKRADRHPFTHICRLPFSHFFHLNGPNGKNRCENIKLCFHYYRFWDKLARSWGNRLRQQEMLWGHVEERYESDIILSTSLILWAVRKYHISPSCLLITN